MGSKFASLRRHEGYLLIDNRNSPGVPDAILREVSPGLPPGAGQGEFEAPTNTCSHCQVIVILNPLRTRDRPYCMACDHYICDRCAAVMAATGRCSPFKQLIDRVQEAALKPTEEA